MHWISMFPDAYVDQSPGLLYWLGCAQHQTTPEAGLSSLQSALELFRQAGDVQACRRCLVTLLGKGFVGYAAVGAMNSWLDELLSLMDSSHPYENPDDELRVQGALSFALFYVRPWHPDTRHCLHRVETLLMKTRDVALKLAMAASAVAHCAWTGEIDAGERILADADVHVGHATASPSEAAWALTWFGYLRFVQARYEDALDFIGRAWTLAEKNGLRLNLREILYQRFMVEMRCAGWSVAAATLAEMEAMPASQRPLTQSLLSLYQSRRASHRGRVGEAARLVGLSHKAVMRTGSVFQEMLFSLVTADVLLNDDRVVEARDLIQHARGIVQRARVFDCFRAAIAFVEAWLAMKEDRQDAMLVALPQALVLAREGYSRLQLRYLECALPKLLMVALTHDIESEEAAAVVRLFRLTPPADAPEQWPWPVRINTLGRFEVRLNDAPVTFSRKLPRKVLLLLKAIIARGAQEVSEQALCDALWPDEEGDAAKHALDVTLARLRKLLGSVDAIALRGGRISINLVQCRIDAQAFETYLAVGCADEALRLYVGEFLPEDRDLPCSVPMRERLRGKFIHYLDEQGKAFEASGDLDAAVLCYLRGVDADPIVESFHQGLMRCYELMGRRSQAMSVYRSMRQTLSVVLAVSPSAESQEIYAKLLGEQRD